MVTEWNLFNAASVVTFVATIELRNMESEHVELRTALPADEGVDGFFCHGLQNEALDLDVPYFGLNGPYQCTTCFFFGPFIGV